MGPQKSTPPPSVVLDAAALKAFAHPLRVRLWELLEERGPATATQLAKAIGESSGSTSYHLRQLSRHQLIEEVPGRGTARERWWRANPGGIAFDANRFRQDPSTAGAAEMLAAEVFRQRAEELFRWLQESRTTPEAWVQASVDKRAILQLSRPELEHLTRDVLGILDQYRAISLARQGSDIDAGEAPAPPVAASEETARVIVHFDAFPVGFGEPEPHSQASEDAS